ncbi:MAG: gamma carbonic anhydrase family protein [Bacteroidota bacterium]
MRRSRYGDLTTRNASSVFVTSGSGIPSNLDASVRPAGAGASGIGFPESHAPPSVIDAFLGLSPRIGREVFVAESAAVIGDVTLGDGASIWYGASLRGDVHWIEVGAGSNVQDNATVHVTRGVHPCRIGTGVTIGHNAVVHGCTIEDDVLIGMGAVVLDGAVIGHGSLVGAGALVTGGTVIPPGSLVLGSPARVVRQLDEAEIDATRANATHYVRMARMCMGIGPAGDDGNPFYVDERPDRNV